MNGMAGIEACGVLAVPNGFDLTGGNDDVTLDEHTYAFHAERSFRRDLRSEKEMIQWRCYMNKEICICT